MSSFENSRPAPEGGAPRGTHLWMVTYADLMSTLVIFFLTLYAYVSAGGAAAVEHTLASIQKEMAATRDEAKVFELKMREAELAARLKKDVGAALAEGLFGVHLTAERVRLTLPSPALFESGSAELKPGIQDLLGGMAETLRDMPNHVVVEGHTDNVPIGGGRFRSNRALSAARAFSVIEFFAARGLPQGRFSAFGYGEHRPVAPNDTPESRQRNRRIEISVMR